MKIAVVGTGYVGLVVGACLAETGNTVCCLDADASRIEGLKQNRLAIYEPGLLELVTRNQADGRLVFTTDPDTAVSGASVVFIAVGTPQDEDGSADLTHILAVAKMIRTRIDREVVIVIKSTVPVGTSEQVSQIIADSARVPFHMCSNPEFLKEGAAVDDFLKPDRVVLGVVSDFARNLMSEIYAPFLRTGKPLIFMDIPSAELTKYVANGMLATRISYMNEIANLCEKVGADIDLVRKGIGSDARIGASFLFPGPGYGGSCLPKDVHALTSSARQAGSALGILEAVAQANEAQKRVLFQKTQEICGGSVHGKKVAIWGLSFKPQTDDMRESPALKFIEELLEAGANVVAHDPAAMHEAARRLGPKVQFALSCYDALTGADVLVIVTDWNEYRHPSFEVMMSRLKSPKIVDGRNLYDPLRMRAIGFAYTGIGRQ